MIRESIVTTRKADGNAHIAPMGIHVIDDYLVFMPFRPSTSLDNLLRERRGVINYTDDVRVFAGCLTGRYDWPVTAAIRMKGWRLTHVLAHAEVEIQRIEDDPVRPKLYGCTIYAQTHRPFQGFNRAQAAVIEAAILVSRLDRLPWSKIEQELNYLKIAIEKTAGVRERIAWDWLMEAVASHRDKLREDTTHDLNAG